MSEEAPGSVQSTCSFCKNITPPHHPQLKKKTKRSHSCVNGWRCVRAGAVYLKGALLLIPIHSAGGREIKVQFVGSKKEAGEPLWQKSAVSMRRFPPRATFSRRTESAGNQLYPVKKGEKNWWRRRRRDDGKKWRWNESHWKEEAGWNPSPSTVSFFVGTTVGNLKVEFLNITKHTC